MELWKTEKHVFAYLHLWHKLTFVCSEEACGIAPPCNGGVVCDWVEAPRDELERKEWKEGQSLNPTWAAEKDAAFSGLGCRPSARRGTRGGKKKKKKNRGSGRSRK